MRPLNEQVILITGATDGLGKALALELASAGATLLLHGRDDRRGQETINDIRATAPSSSLHWHRADLSSLEEVRDLASAVAAEHERLDVLVNNAGVGSTLPGDGKRMESADGFELRFAVNYLATFLLTRLLQPLLVRSAPSRIVNVSSAGQAPIDFDDVMLERGYGGQRAYAQSKLAQIMFTFDLAEDLAGTGVTANCLHPATFMPTKIVLAARGGATSTLEEGVRATMRLVTDPDLETATGRYYNGLREARAMDQAYDADARGRLRRLSEELTAVVPR
ncbi:MAG TPA: SDR family NAD(P)-dependent oxidoreductase [Acidimicrobiales bacterium]|nr:SDR family NAD(P)-dependent oxidoreductase [Acidimicrobiales bacterium]